MQLGITLPQLLKGFLVQGTPEDNYWYYLGRNPFDYPLLCLSSWHDFNHVGLGVAWYREIVADWNYKLHKSEDHLRWDVTLDLGVWSISLSRDGLCNSTGRVADC